MTENADRFIVNVYNPVPRTVDKYIRVPVNINGMVAFYGFQVLDSNGIWAFQRILILINSTVYQ